MTPSVSTPKDHAREDERVEKAREARAIAAYCAFYRTPRRPWEKVDAEDRERWCKAVDAAASVSPSPADPVRAALEEARAGFEEWFTRSNLGADLRRITACAFHDAWRAALATLSNPPGRQGEEVPYAWALYDQALRAVDDVEDYERVELASEIDAAELARFKKAGRATPLYLSPQDAALVHPPQEGGREGLVCLPAEPTHEMYVACHPAFGSSWFNFREMYRALLAAAPTPSPAVPGSGEGK